MKKIYLYHTNDLHSHFENWPRIVGYLNSQKKVHDANKEPFLRIDLGDHADRFHPVTEGTMGAANVDLLNNACYDFVTIGNNEGITFTKDALQSMYEARTFNVLLSNLFDDQGNRPNWCLPYNIIDIDGTKIGFTGATAPFTPFYSKLGWDIKDPFDYLPAIIKTLREKADIVVLLSHLGMPADQKAAREIDGIDIILGAHTHQLLENGEWCENTLIAQTGKFGSSVGKLEIQFDDKKKKIHKLTEKAVILESEPDRDTEELLQLWYQRSANQLSEQITQIDYDIAPDDFQDNELGLVLANALREWCEADIGMVNGGIIVDLLKKGPVTKGDLHRVCPHPINPCKVVLTGNEILDILMKSSTEAFQKFELKGFGFRGKRIGKLIFSGLTYDLQKGNPINVLINREPLETDQSYQVATTDMFTFGRLLPQVKEAPIKDFYLPEMLRDLLAWKLRQ